MLLVKAKAEALEFTVSEKDAEIELLQQRQERQETQVAMNCAQSEQVMFIHMLQLQHAGCLQDTNRGMLTAQQLCCMNIAGVLPVMSSCESAQSG